MKLEIVGAGWGRTGTQSLKLALEQLELGPCYHMIEVFGQTEHVAHWAAAARGETPDWDAIFSGYRSTVDWPAVAFWRELAAANPEARVLLSYRDGDAWYESFRNTIYRTMTADHPPEPAWIRELFGLSRELVLERALEGRPDDRAHAIRCFEAHNARVRDEVPAERLILYEVGSGWAPLCAALGRPIPDSPYPKTNTTEEFQQRMLRPRDAGAP
jgi:hypothetical protein